MMFCIKTLKEKKPETEEQKCARKGTIILGEDEQSV